MSATLLTVLAVIIACTGYAAGRLHQWYRTGVDRDEAYREGYDTATRSTFSLAARLVGPRRDRSGVRASAAVHGGRAGASPAVAPGADAAGRHLVPDELVRAPTYRLAPGRVARAKVHGPARPDDGAADPAARPPVPKPRSS